MSSWVLEQPTRRLLTVKYLPQWQRGLWNPRVQESFLCALTWWLHLCWANVCCLWIFISILIMQMKHQQIFVESAQAGTKPPILEPFPCLKIKAVSPSFPTCVFQARPCSSHLLTFLFQAACSLASPQNLSLSEAQKWAFLSQKRACFIPVFYGRSEIGHSRHSWAGDSHGGFFLDWMSVKKTLIFNSLARYGMHCYTKISI